MVAALRRRGRLPPGDVRDGPRCRRAPAGGEGRARLSSGRDDLPPARPRRPPRHPGRRAGLDRGLQDGIGTHRPPDRGRQHAAAAAGGRHRPARRLRESRGDTRRRPHPRHPPRHPRPRFGGGLHRFLGQGFQPQPGRDDRRRGESAAGARHRLRGPSQGLSLPRPSLPPGDRGVYDHLARVMEWSIGGDEEGEP